MFIQCQRPLPPIGTPAEIALMPEDRWRRVCLLLRKLRRTKLHPPLFSLLNAEGGT